MIKMIKFVLSNKYKLDQQNIKNQLTIESNLIKRQIEDALRRSATIDSQQVTVDVTHHKVILTGDVHSHAEQDEVERIAWRAREVAQVENCITITPWGDSPGRRTTSSPYAR